MEGQDTKQSDIDSEPELLYHYTSLDGFLGIIKNKELWATDIRYLNDTSEFQTVPNLAVENIIEATNLEGQNNELIEKYRPLLVQAGRSVYVSSFSAGQSGDDLSQWRAYGGQHSGISLGLSPDYLRSIGKQFLYEASDLGWATTNGNIDPLIKCEYLDDKKPEDKRAISLNIERLVEHSKVDPSSAALAFAQYSASLKHKGFHSEKEWRLALVRNCSDPSNRLQFRSSKSLIVPYVSIPLNIEREPITIKRIVLGPTPHEEMAKESVEMVLNGHGVKFGEVVNSQIPYRNW
jgi:hypothetical protein